MLNGEPALLVTTMKNEGPYILEWISHHMAIGIDRFIVVTNDCDDLTDRILDRLEVLLPLKHVPNPKSLIPERTNWHVMALRYASLFNLYKDSGWIYFSDVDEFLQVFTGDGSLDALFEAADGFDVASFTSMPFGSGGVKAIEDKPVVSQFTVQSKAYEELRAKGGNARNAIKSIFHNRIKFTVRRNHRPRRSDFSSTGYKWIDGSGRVFSDEWTDGKDKGVSPFDTVELAQFNHYAVRSAEAFLVKVARGDAVTKQRLDTTNNIKYWNAYNGCGDPDTRATVPSAEATRLFVDLQKDPTLADLHAQSVQIHRDKAQKLIHDPNYYPLVKELGLAEAAP